MATCVIILWRVDVTSLTTSVSTMHFLAEIMLILRAIKSNLKGYMIDRILHSWPFHMKFMNSPKARFINYIGNDHSSKILHIQSTLDISHKNSQTSVSDPDREISTQWVNGYCRKRGLPSFRHYPLTQGLGFLPIGG